jgi:hypothetical protein
MKIEFNDIKKGDKLSLKTNFGSRYHIRVESTNSSLYHTPYFIGKYSRYDKISKKWNHSLQTMPFFITDGKFKKLKVCQCPL